jgi:type IV secretion system protein TrbB
MNTVVTFDMSFKNHTTTQEKVIKHIISSLTSEISAALQDDKVIEIMVNPDNTIWTDTLGSGMKQVGTIQPSRTLSIINSVAGYVDKVINTDSPILECEFPLDGSRFQALIPRAVANPTFALRKKAKIIFTLSDYIEQGIMSQHQKDLIETAVKDHKNIVIVGGTSSGKTTLANAIIAAISETTPDDRIIIIEDTHEIQSKQKNVVQLHTTDVINMSSLLRSTLRLRPDRIVVGEVRGGEALNLIKAWNTGHPGGVATIHANSAISGLQRLESMIGEVSQVPQHHMIAEAANIVIFIEKHQGSRRLREIIQVSGYESEQYQTKQIH